VERNRKGKRFLGSVKRKKFILVVGISTGSGVVYEIRFLEVATNLGIETHVVVLPFRKGRNKSRSNLRLGGRVESLSSKYYRFGDIATPISSGSFKTDVMVIIPRSMKTAGRSAPGYADNLLPFNHKPKNSIDIVDHILG
jgi:4-hydroxy-3-polyprenylbenzoate decarboxylase